MDFRVTFAFLQNSLLQNHAKGFLHFYLGQQQALKEADISLSKQLMKMDLRLGLTLSEILYCCLDQFISLDVIQVNS